jgi:hypothetical protein
MQQLHPGTSRRDFAHAAFRAVVDMSYEDAELGYRIYDFALALRRAA